MLCTTLLIAAAALACSAACCSAGGRGGAKDAYIIQRIQEANQNRMEWMMRRFDEPNCLRPRYWTRHDDAKVVELAADWDSFCELMQMSFDDLSLNNIRVNARQYGKLAARSLRECDGR